MTGVLGLPVLAQASVSGTGKGGGKGAELVKITTSDAVTLEAAFLKPASPNAPGVILVHDAGSDRSQLEPIAERLNKEGFGVLSLDLRGHGGSKGATLDWSKLSDADKTTTWSSASMDLDAAAQWMGKQKNILSTSLSVVATGSGCTVAVRHVKNDENVVCMALLAPHANDFGYDIRAEIQTLGGGVPTFVASAKDAEAERLAHEVNSSSDKPFVEIFLAQAKLASPLDDKKLPGRVSSWVAEKCMPKKGK